MNHLSLGAGWLWLIDNKLHDDSVPVASPCWNNPPASSRRRLSVWDTDIRFFGSRYDFMGALVRWPGKPCGSNPASHCTQTAVQSQHLLQGSSVHTAVKTRCFMTGTFCFSSSLALSFSLLLPILLLPITRLTMPSAQPHSAACLFSPVKPPFYSQLSAKFYWKLRYIDLLSFVDFLSAWSSCHEADGKFSVLLL